MIAAVRSRKKTLPSNDSSDLHRLDLGIFRILFHKLFGRIIRLKEEPSAPAYGHAAETQSVKIL